jgi:opacity protein-like surface antigen
MRLTTSLLVRSAVVAAFVATGVPAAADEWALVVDGGLRTMSNSRETENAIFAGKKGFGFGGGLFYDRGSRWRFGVEGRKISREGERAFAADRNSEAFRLGHPLSFDMTEGLASISYRFSSIGPVSPYVGIGAGVVSWREESDIVGLIEKASGSTGLFEARVGFERKQGRLRLALEGGITLAGNAIGVGGISRVYEEDDIGGVFVVAKIGVSR